MTPPAVEEHFSRTTLNGLLCEDFTACPMNSSLHLDSDTEAAVGLGVVLTGDQQERGLRPAEHLADRGQYWRAGA